MFSPYVLFLFLNPKPYTSMHSFAFNFKILETNQNSHFFHTRNMFPLVFLVFFTNLNFKAQPKLPWFHLYSFCIFPVHSFAFNFKHFTNQNLHFFTPLRPPPWGALLPFFFPLFFGLFANPKPETPMHSFASNFKNFTNQNHHFFTPLRPPPLGGTAALFLPLIFWPFCKPQT